MVRSFSRPRVRQTSYIDPRRIPARSMIKRIILRIIIITFAAHVGCTHSINVTDAEWEENTDKYASYWKNEPNEIIFEGDYIFHLTDGNTINPTRLAKTDSTFVIYEVYKGGGTELEEPLVVPLDKVESIEKITMWWGPTLAIWLPPILGLTILLILFSQEDGPIFGT